MVPWAMAQFSSFRSCQGRVHVLLNSVIKRVNDFDSLLQMAGSLKTILFLGSTREGRMGLRVAKFMKKQLEAASHTVELCGSLYSLFYRLSYSISL